jgi:hypothetical protein
MAESNDRVRNPMGDGSAEWCFSRPRRINVNKLVVIRGVGECVDARLRNLDPL